MNKNKILKKDIVIKGISCPDCLGKIEREVACLDGISSAVVNIIDRVLTIYIKNSANQEITLANVIKTIPKIERGASAYEKRKNMSDDLNEEYPVERKKEFLKFVVGCIFFALAVIIRKPFSIQLVFYIVAFLFIGSDIVLKACRNIVGGHIFDKNFLMSIATIGALCIGEYWEAVTVMFLYKIGQ